MKPLYITKIVKKTDTSVQQSEDAPRHIQHYARGENPEACNLPLLPPRKDVHGNFHLVGYGVTLNERIAAHPVFIDIAHRFIGDIDGVASLPLAGARILTDEDAVTVLDDAVAVLRLIDHLLRRPARSEKQGEKPEE